MGPTVAEWSKSQWKLWIPGTTFLRWRRPWVASRKAGLKPLLTAACFSWLLRRLKTTSPKPWTFQLFAKGWYTVGESFGKTPDLPSMVGDQLNRFRVTRCKTAGFQISTAKWYIWCKVCPQVQDPGSIAPWPHPQIWIGHGAAFGASTALETLSTWEWAPWRFLPAFWIPSRWFLPGPHTLLVPVDSMWLEGGPLRRPPWIGIHVV